MATRSQTDELEDLATTINTPGWGILMDQVRDELSSIKDSFMYVEDNNKFHFLRGKANVLETMLGYENKVELLRQEVEDVDATV